MTDETKITDEITIVIEESQNARLFEKGNSFFRKELEQAKDFILKHVEKKNKESENKEGKKIDNQEEYFRQHNSIAILGPRGVGKTSFLLSLKDFIKNDKKIVWLPHLDPTRIEENDTFLIIVVANILKEIKRRLNGDLNQKIREKLEVLSRDFAVIAPRQVQEEQWKNLIGDPTNFAYELLNQAHSGLSLAHSFHEFLSVCSKVMEAKVFVQPIDDVDCAIDQGWPILETLRRYLATPYLITILSGDMPLYQLLVKKQQVDKLKSLIKLGKVIENQPESQTTEITGQVSQLTDQYLAKVIPSDLRIHLTPLSIQIMDLAERRKDFVKLQYNSSSNQTEERKDFSEVYVNLSHDLFNTPKLSKEDNIEILKKSSWLPLPLLPITTRDMVKFLKVIHPWSVDTKEDNKADKEKAIEKLVHVFFNSLYNGQIKTEDLLALKAGKHLEWLAEYCLNIDQQHPGFWTMESRYDFDKELNHRVLLLQAFLFQAWKLRREPRKDELIYSNTNKKPLLYPDGPLSFAIKVCFPCWIADTYHPVKDELERMKQLLNVGITKRHTYLAVEGLSYMMDFVKRSSDNLYYGGIVNISSIDFYGELRDKIGPDWQKGDASFISSLFIVQPNIGYSSWISILIGFARLADVLREDPNDSDQLKNLLFLLTESGMSQISSTENKLRSQQKAESYRIEPLENSQLIEYLFAWTQKMRMLDDEQLAPPLVISRTFTRFTRNLESIYRNDPSFKSITTLGNILELWIVAFLNSLLIEEVIFKKGILNADLRLDHLTEIKENKSSFFNDNLVNDKEKTIKNTIPYTLAMLCCPLLLIFLEKTFEKFDSDLFEKVDVYTNVADGNMNNKNYKEDYKNFLKNCSEKLYSLSIEKPEKPKKVQSIPFYEKFLHS